MHRAGKRAGTMGKALLAHAAKGEPVITLGKQWANTTHARARACVAHTAHTQTGTHLPQHHPQRPSHAFNCTQQPSHATSSHAHCPALTLPCPCPPDRQGLPIAPADAASTPPTAATALPAAARAAHAATWAPRGLQSCGSGSGPCGPLILAWIVHTFMNTPHPISTGKISMNGLNQ